MALTKEQIAERLAERALKALKITLPFRYQKEHLRRELLKEIEEIETETKPLVEEDGLGPGAY